MSTIAADIKAATAASIGLQLLEKSAITFFVGKIIEQASGPAAQLAKAKSILTVTQSLEQVNGGSAAGIAGLQTAFLSLISTVKDEALQLVFNGLLASVLTELATLETSGGLLAKVGGLMANDFLSYVSATAQAYVTELSATPA